MVKGETKNRTNMKPDFKTAHVAAEFDQLARPIVG